MLITLAYVGALAASIQAFGGGPGVILIGAVYMGAAAIAAAAPSPGGLGAIEAALVAGLTGVGMAGGTRRFRRAAVPAGHLLAAGGAGLAVLARPATAGATYETTRGASGGLHRAGGRAVSLYVLNRSRLVRSREAVSQHGAVVITVGSFDFPESVLLAEIYGQALAAGKFPVRILPNLGPPRGGGSGADGRPGPAGARVRGVGAGIRQPGKAVRHVRCRGGQQGHWRGRWRAAGSWRRRPAPGAGRQRDRGHRRDRGPLLAASR